MPDLGVFLLPAAALVVAVAAWGVARGVDVRLALLAAAFALAALAGDVAPILQVFLATFSSEKFVIPICTAMGFAYVLRHTACDQHLVHLLTKPLRHGRVFLIPGVVAVGFLVNIPVISQTSTAVCLGAVVVPLMRAARLSNATIGACILLGASIGGELLNPGAPELNTVGQRLEIAPTKIVPAIVPLIVPHLAIATAIFWFLSLRAERRAGTVAELQEAPAAFRLNIIRAAVPLVPLALLFLVGPPLNVFRVPSTWLEVPGKGESHYETRLIGAAMLVGVLAAAAAAPRVVRGVPKAFFDGAGYAFAEIISLIVTATCFGKAIEGVGVAALIGSAIERVPGVLIPAAGAVPLGFAALSGSGMAATQSLFGFFVEPARALGVDPVDVGAVVSIAAAAGRTMSPVAAVALMAGKLTGTSSLALAGRVAPPLLISIAIVIGLRMAGVL